MTGKQGQKRARSAGTKHPVGRSAQQRSSQSLPGREQRDESRERAGKRKPESSEQSTRPEWRGSRKPERSEQSVRPERRGNRKLESLEQSARPESVGEHKSERQPDIGRKLSFAKPGNFLYPVPAVMVSCRDGEDEANIITVAWAGTVCSDPPMLSISVRRERYSHELIQRAGEFVVNLVNEPLLWATDFCGVKSGRTVDKYAACGLHMGKSVVLETPTIAESPVNIECRLKDIIPLGSHDLMLAEVVHIQVDERYMDERGGFHLEQAGLIHYTHGRYFSQGVQLGSFGYSVRKQAR